MRSLLQHLWLPFVFWLLIFALMQLEMAVSLSPTASQAPKATPATKIVPSPTKSVISSAPPPKVLAPPPKVLHASAPPPKVLPSSAPPPKLASLPPSSAPPPRASASPAPLPSPPKPSHHASPPSPSPKPPTASTHLHSPPPKSLPHPKNTSLSPSPSLPPSTSTSLAPSQLAALLSLHINYNTPDPCAPSNKDLLVCDLPSPTRHLTALHLANCAPDAKLSTQALLNLSTLQALSFDNCSMQPVHVPSLLVKSLQSFMCTASLGKTGTNEKAQKLPGVWLSKLHNLNDITVANVEVSASGLNIITAGLKLVTQLTLSGLTIAGTLPKNTWPPDVEHIDVSVNSIRGSIPSQMRKLSKLKYLDLSHNQLKGVIPNFFGELSNLNYINLAGNELSGPIPGSVTELFNCSHLDLSNNKLNGSVLANISNMRALRYLDLSQNDLVGEITFNTSFLQRLTTFKIGSNAGLCYNHTAVKSKFLAGIANCVPVAAETTAPAPAPALDSVVSASGGGNHLSKGAIVGIAVVVILVAAALVFVLVRWRRSRDDPDQFINLRAQRP